MTNCTDDLLAIIKQQQAQISELMRQNGVLVGKVGTGGKPAASQAANTTVANAAALAAAKVAASAAANAASPGRRNHLDFWATYTATQKVKAKAKVKKIDAGTMDVGGTRGTCILCGKHYGTARCFEINVNAHLRPPSWKSLFD